MYSRTHVPTYSLALTHSRTRALHSFVPPPGCCDDGPQRRDADLWCVLTSTAERSHDPTLSLALRSSLFARLPGDNTVTDASGNTANIVKVVPVGNGAVILVDLVMLPSSE